MVFSFSIAAVRQRRIWLGTRQEHGSASGVCIVPDEAAAYTYADTQAIVCYPPEEGWNGHVSGLCRLDLFPWLVDALLEAQETL
jgi:hypothetical protein